ncbi:alpha-amylase family glycosyl hydrolase [Flavobacterium sp.]|uniref:alpha-amylase family glycosyl hydrolase n=1 Tax=Flavobacterium sp. TaxID=239 RepID=UPI0026362604|nr:alpha-amylase family glycosyl hydrolase [Flavobacterium sp.]MDD2985067.1 alpha-amylase family glycosyl hydrolase [Flavobacterium sp.]
MKKYIVIFILSLFSGIVSGQVTITPSTFNVTDQITITVSTAAQACNLMGTNPAKVYMHAGIGDDTNAFGFSVVGNWGQDNGLGLMTNNGNGTWSITLTPSVYFGINATQQANATKLGMVFRNANGSQTLKEAPSCTDFIFNVGTFQVNLTSPANNSATIINANGSLTIAANNTGGNASYVLKSNGAVLNSNPSTSSYSYNHTTITSNQNYILEVTQGSSTIFRSFSVLVNPGVIPQAVPAGVEDGINYNPSDATRATLKLNAPGKDFVYVAGSFNNWQPNSSYAMKKDPSTNIFWLELTGLNPGELYTYQYWVVDQTPVTNSPVLVKAADMYSTLVLSPYDDEWIPNSSYPNMPAYPQGQEREVTVLQTGQQPYPWSQATLNFQKPNKDNLVVYEVLVRDFDANRTFQDLINRMSYFTNLKVNAIQLMPVMEFEGNESWGYNTAFHMALDKFYGTQAKLKELVDLCHQNGIAVILDVALNHAFGRNPGVRMWMSDPDGDGWGPPATDNPYFNTVARHSYGVGDDFNHQSALTKYYTKRVIKHWIQEYKIDGFRWDLTKGFTQNCTAGDETCTNNYQADRVAVLKEYADYSWSIDPNHYAIFEHLGSDNEEQQWANYRINEGKGVMMWGELWTPYKQLISGNSANADISRMGHVSRGFQGKRLLGYPESHDKDRIIYEAVTFGNGGGTAPVNNNLNNTIPRMKAIGATSILIPGPKMIWHFQELGMDDSIFTCSNGTVNTDYDTAPGDCKLDTKPQPQWVENWLGDALRNSVYNAYSKFIALKKNEPVFNGEYSISPNGNNIRQRIYVFNNSLPSTQLKNVVILANFSVANQNITPDFPYIGTWYDLMTEAPINVTSTTAQITLAPGEFKVYGNRLPTLSTDSFELRDDIALAPNPANDSFSITIPTTSVEIYSVTGQVVKRFEKGYDENDRFDVSDLTKGIYFVRVKDLNNREKSMKLIKN